MSQSPSASSSSSRQCGTCGGPMFSGPLGVQCPQCAFSFAEVPENDEAAHAAELFPELEVEEKIAQGGFGGVFRAQHRRMKRTVALKFLDTVLARSPDAVALFEQEMISVGGLNHPGIVTAYDAGERDGQWYLIMEYVDGMDCGALVRKHGTLPIAESCEIIRQAALALHHAHGFGMVHRDVKPGNMMVSAGGRPLEEGTEGAKVPEAVPSVPSVPSVPASVKVLDFGLAGLAVAPVFGAPAAAGGTTRFLGTLEYTAPEQIESPQVVDAKADIYSLGATLWRFLTGKTPHPESGEMSLLRHMKCITSQAVPSIATVRPDLPKPLVQLCNSLLARSPSDRPATAEEVARLIEPWCSGAQLSRLFSDIALTDKSLSLVHQLQRLARRHKLATALFFVALATVLTAAVLGFVMAQQAQRGEVAMAAERDKAQRAEADAHSARNRAEREAYQGALQLARVHLSQGEPYLAAECLQSTKADLREWEWGYLLSATPQAEAGVESALPDAAAIASTPDGLSVVVVQENLFRLLDVKSASVVLHLEQPSRINKVAISQDGTMIALGLDHQGDQMSAIRVLNRAGDLQWEVPFASDGLDLAWETPLDGALIGVNANRSKPEEGSLLRLDRASGKVLTGRSIRRQKLTGIGLVPGPAGKMLIVRTSHSSFDIVSLPALDTMQAGYLMDNLTISDFLLDDAQGTGYCAWMGGVCRFSVVDNSLTKLENLFDPSAVAAEGSKLPALNLQRMNRLPDGRWLAVSDRLEMSEGSTIARRPAVKERASVSISGGRRVALLSGGRVEIRPDTLPPPPPNLPAGECPNNADGRMVAFSPDSQRLIVQDWGRESLFVNDLQHPANWQTIATKQEGRDGEWARLPVWHPDGSAILSYEGRPSTLRLDQNGKMINQPLPLPGNIWSAAPTSDGRLVAFGTRSGVILFDWTSRSILHESPLPGGPFNVFSMADQATFFALGADGILYHFGGKEISSVRVTGAGDLPAATAFHAGLGLLAIGGSNEIRVLQLAAAEAPRQIHRIPSQGRVTGLAFDPAARRLASADAGRHFIIWDWRENLALLEFPLRATTASIAYSPDGRWLAYTDFAPTALVRSAQP